MVLERFATRAGLECCIIAILLIAIFTFSSVSSPQRRVETIIDHPSKQTHSHFAIIINTYRRHALLLEQLQLYTGCPAVGQVHILWSESPNVPATILHAVQAHSPRVQIHLHWPNRSLNLRFQPPAGLLHDAVVSLDDDIMVSCSDLIKTYQVCRHSTHTT